MAKKPTPTVSMPVTEDGVERFVDVELTDPTEDPAELAAVQAEVSAPPPPLRERVQRPKPSGARPHPLDLFMAAVTNANKPKPDEGWLACRWVKGESRPAMAEWFADRDAAGERCQAEREQFPDRDLHRIVRQIFSTWDVISVSPTGETKTYQCPRLEEAEHLRLRLAAQTPELKIEIGPHVSKPKELVDAA